jgi:hypothetical protein
MALGPPPAGGAPVIPGDEGAPIVDGADGVVGAGAAIVGGGGDGGGPDGVVIVCAQAGAPIARAAAIAAPFTRCFMPAVSS